MKVIDIVIIVVYFALIFVIGITGSRNAKTSEDFAVAGRRLKLPMYVGCVIAGVLGGASTIGSTGLGYQYGISGAWLVIMLGLGLVLIGLFFVEKIVDLKVLTISEFLEKRFNDKTQVLSAVVSAIYALMVCATQIISLGTVLQAILGWDPRISMVLVGCLSFAYTVLGGMWALSLTDFIHSVVITIGILLLLLPFSIYQAGGIGNIIASAPKEVFSFTTIGWPTILQYFLLYGLGIIIGQDIWQQVFTAKNKDVAKKGTVLAGAYSMFYGVAVAVAGICAKLVFPDIADSQSVLFHSVINFLPTGVIGIVLAAVFAALMSAASGTLLASSTLITNDVIVPFFRNRNREIPYVTVTRWITGVLGGVAIISAIAVGNIISALNIAYAYLTGTLFVPILCAFFWKKVQARTVNISILISFIAVTISMIIYTPDSIVPILIGIVASFLIVVMMTLFSKEYEEDSIEAE